MRSPEEIDGPGLPVILRKDCAIRALFRRNSTPCNFRFVGNLFPTELIGVPLRQCGACM